MRNRGRAVAWLSASGVLLASCFIAPPVIRVAELLPDAGRAGPPAELVFAVRIERFEDARPNRKAIGYKTGLGGVVDIVADGDVAAVFETLVTRALERKGIRSGPSALRLKGIVRRASVGNLPFSGEVKAEVAVELTLYDSQSKAQLWSRAYRGSGTGRNRQAVLAAAFRDVAQGLRRDDSILASQAAQLASANSSRRMVPVARPSPAFAAARSGVPSSDVDSLPLLDPVPRTNAYAIVVGIETYRQQLPKADFAAHDARVVGEYLVGALGFLEENVVVLLDDRATKSDLEKYIEGWLPNRVEDGDSVFVYFSGHGAPNPQPGKAYLVPYDGDPSFMVQTGYPLERLYEHLATLPAGEVVVMLDSCFSGAGGRSVIAKGMRPLVLSVENPVLARGKTVVLAASSGDQVSSTYLQKGHGLLTYFFLKGLRGDADANRDRNVDLRELFDYLKPQVERVARREFNNEQTPQLLGSPELLDAGVVLLERIDP